MSSRPLLDAYIKANGIVFGDKKLKELMDKVEDEEATEKEEGGEKLYKYKVTFSGYGYVRATSESDAKARFDDYDNDVEIDDAERVEGSDD